MRPEPLAEPRHWFIPGLEALCLDDAGAPSLSLPGLADRAAEVVDSSSLRFLTASALEARRKEEDEERRKVEEQEKLKTMTEEEARLELRTLLAVPAPRRTAEQEERSRACRAVLAAAHKRKKKKRRKKKLPKASSSRSLPARAARTRKSGHSSTSSSWYVYSGGVMSSVACESSFLLGMYWLLQHSANSVLDCAYCWSFGVKVATFLWTWWKTRVVLPSMLAGFAGYDAPRAVFPSFVALADETRGDSTGAVLVQGDMPVVFASGAFHQTTQITVEIPQLPFFGEVVHISFRGAEADSCGPTVCRTTEVPLLLGTVIDVPVVQVVRVPVLFVGRLPWLCGPYVLWECLRRDVVWWWIFHSWWCLRFCLGQCEADDWKIHHQLFPVPEIVGCVCMLNYWFSSNDEILPSLTTLLLPGSS